MPEAPPEAERLKQLYRVGDDGRLRLRKLPGRAADTLLLVLYGLYKLQDKKSVYAPGMTSAARASGAAVDRADRLLAGYDDLVEGFGKRRAKQYRLTAAGREHCARLVEELVGPFVPGGPGPAISAESAGDDAIPAKVTSRWDGEVLTLAQTAALLGVEEAEVGKLRRAHALLGLPGGTRKRPRYFYPAFQLDAARGEIHPQARAANELICRIDSSWQAAEWWSRVEPNLGRRPLELIDTPEADAVVRAAEAKYPVLDLEKAMLKAGDAQGPG